METWRGFWRLNGYARSIALEAAAALTATWIGLRLMGFRRWQAVLSWFAPIPATRSNSAALAAAREIARLEQAAARRLFFRANCLQQSLALWWLLRRRGISADLRIGARKEAGRFEAHAWVELDGTILNDVAAELAPFVPFDGFVSSLLVANSYATLTLDADLRAREFAALGRLLAAVPVWRLRPPADATPIGLLRDRIVESCRGLRNRSFRVARPT
jgi:Transglutaminase-like superfamily